MAGQFTASGPGQWGFWPRWLMSVAAYGVLIAVQAGMPLQFNTPTARKFDTPITPAAYAFSIWGIIFSLQALALLVACLPAAAGWARPMFVHTGGLVAATWLAEAGWTTCQYAQQQLRPGYTPAFYAAAACLIAGHVLVSLALRSAVVALQALMRRSGPSAIDEQLLRAQGRGPTLEQRAAAAVAHAREGGIGAGGIAGACALFVVPCALNAGWMGLASCLGILQVCASHGAAYGAMVLPGLALMVVASLTLALQPWVAVPPPPATIQSHLPFAVAHVAYKAVLAWGLVAMRYADTPPRPQQVQDLALYLALALPAISAAGVAIRAWLGHGAAGGRAPAPAPHIKYTCLQPAASDEGGAVANPAARR